MNTQAVLRATWRGATAWLPGGGRHARAAALLYNAPAGRLWRRGCYLSLRSTERRLELVQAIKQHLGALPVQPSLPNAQPVSVYASIMPSHSKPAVVGVRHLLFRSNLHLKDGYADLCYLRVSQQCQTAGRRLSDRWCRDALEALTASVRASEIS